MRKVIDLLEEPRGEIYARLLGLAETEASEAYLIVRSSLPLSERAKAALEQLEPHQVAVRTTSAWPGTTLGGGSALMFMYRMSPALASTLRLAADGLYDWQQPDLPEDLGFIRPDGSVWLASIAHERDAYFELSDEEAKDLFDRLPELSDAIND